MRGCFEEWEGQFKKLESWHEELMEGDVANIIWEAFQAGWEGHTNSVLKRLQETREKLGIDI